MAATTKRQSLQSLPSERSAKSRLFTVAAIALVALMIIGTIAFAHSYGAKTADVPANPTSAAVAEAQLVTAVSAVFCTDFSLQQYLQAYQLLSQAEQARVGTAAEFAARAQALDSSDGIVRVCQTTNAQPFATLSHDRKSAIEQVSVRRSKQLGIITGYLKFVYEGNAWKIDVIDSALKLF